MSAPGVSNSGWVDGRTRHPLWQTWRNMRQRCRDDWPHYEHVTVCEEWCDFPTFAAWAENAGWYEQDRSVTPRGDMLTIDRIDPAGNYEPANCQWIPKSKNSSRARDNDRRRISDIDPMCTNGHAYTEGNTRWVDGKRRCRACGREAQRRYRAKATT